MMSRSSWSVYLLTCGDGTFYCGCTNDLARRVSRHNSGKGAKYTRARLPVRIASSRGGMTRREALRLEAYIKSLPRKNKLEALQSSNISEFT